MKNPKRMEQIICGEYRPFIKYRDASFILKTIKDIIYEFLNDPHRILIRMIIDIDKPIKVFYKILKKKNHYKK